MTLGYDLPSRFARGLFAVVLLLVWTGAAAPARGQRAAADSPAANDPEARKTIRLLQRMLEAAAEEARKPGGDPSDVPAKAADLQFDVDKCFAFVRDEIAFEPYAGILRGSRGALASRSANALDRSLLLAELLRSGGHRCRIVTGALAPDKARQLVQRFLTDGGRLNMPQESDPHATLARFLDYTGLDPAAVRDYEQSKAADAAASRKAIDDLTGPNAAFLLDHLKGTGVTLGLDFDAWRKLLDQRAASHAWVQVADPVVGGAWTDLDTSFAAAKRGESFAGNATELSAPDPLRHRVDFALVYTRDGTSGPDAQVILDIPLYADQVLYDQPAFAIQPADDMPPPEKLAEMSPEQFVKQIAGIQKYQALLKVGGASHGSRAFDLKGNLFDVGGDGRVEGAQKVGRAIGGTFGGLSGAAESDPGAAGDSRFLKLSVRFTFHVPDEPARTQERVLSTKADVSGEHFVSPLLWWDIFVQPQPLPQELAAHWTLRHTVQSLTPIVSAMAGTVTPADALREVTATTAKPFSPLLVDYALTRQDAAAAALAADAQLALLWDRPQMSLAESRICVHKGTDQMCARARVDLVDNPLAFVPRATDAAAGAALATFRQGVFDTAAEATLLERAAQATVKTPATAITATDAVRKSAGKLVSFSPADDASATPSAVAPPDRAWIKSNEPASRLIIAATPADDAPSVWWSVDRNTGNVLGRASGGGGQAMTERTIKEVSVIVKWILCMGWDVVYAGSKRMTNWSLLRAGICLVGTGLGVAALDIKTPGFLIGMLIWEAVSKSLLKVVPT